MSEVAEFEATLESLQKSRTGISGSKISKLTKISMDHVALNDQFISEVYKYSKKAPGSHKLGALYILDSIVRSYQDAAKKNNESLEAVVDKSYSGGWSKASEVMETLVLDAIQNSPRANAAKVVKLFDIWEKAGTFPVEKIHSLREKLRTALKDNLTESTPNTSTSSSVAERRDNGSHNVTSDSSSMPGHGAATVPVENNAASILEALAAFAQKAPIAQPSAAGSINDLNAHGNRTDITANTSPNDPRQLPAQPAVIPPSIPTQSSSTAPYYSPTSSNAAPSLPLGPSAARSMPSGPAVPSAIDGGINPLQAQKMALMSVLTSQNVPPAQIDAILKAAFPDYPPAAASSVPTSATGFPLPAPTTSQSINLESFLPPKRSRSPSPRGGRSRRSPSPRRDITYNAPASGAPKPSPDGFPRRYALDPTIPPDSIMVYSRTLFLGGITRAVRENVLRSMFERFGAVQSLVVNHNSRHGFLKMFHRDAAEKAQVAMENVPFADTTIRTKWGVGFGPKDCIDFATGISVIPVRLLTDADRTWLVTAEYGGTGGLPITPGVAVDEPDIELGLGISSKAISKRGKELAMRRDEKFRGRRFPRGPQAASAAGPADRYHEPAGNDWNSNSMESNSFHPSNFQNYDQSPYPPGPVSQPPWQSH
ncbi:RNA-binding protein Seb1 [Schizosaccharomyces japonicus yFS275]|uniref:RNA-binding protein Seb1 n=1 Tax=Schizosaccharomyces japonicus (strain yFS275 / FY16936) TaxID=402676 RepID=B6K865_SCHJY|nr:RNA-binding protein Seb1 [Schizosaccharomyces japonicus yFS275]EEB09719.1 RNA-binding protein Seb1 [Schizosaccharomyces japonicus yFS275]